MYPSSLRRTRYPTGSLISVKRCTGPISPSSSIPFTNLPLSESFSAVCPTIQWVPRFCWVCMDEQKLLIYTSKYCMSLDVQLGLEVCRRPIERNAKCPVSRPFFSFAPLLPGLATIGSRILCYFITACCLTLQAAESLRSSGTCCACKHHTQAAAAVPQAHTSCRGAESAGGGRCHHFFRLWHRNFDRHQKLCSFYTHIR